MAAIASPGNRHTLHGTAGIPKEERLEEEPEELLPCQVSPFFVDGSLSPGQHMRQSVRQHRYWNSDAVSREEFDTLAAPVHAMADVLSSLLSDPNVLCYMMDSGAGVAVSRKPDEQEG